MRPNSSGLGVTYLKQLLGVVGVSGMLSLMYRYCLDTYMCRQEYLLPVGLHQNLQYLSTTEGHQVIGKLFRYGVTFSSFLKL